MPKAMVEDRAPWLMKTTLPPPWHYPVSVSAAAMRLNIAQIPAGNAHLCCGHPLLYALHAVQDIAFPFATGLVTMFYGPGLITKVKGLLRVAACFLAPSMVRKSKKT